MEDKKVTMPPLPVRNSRRYGVKLVKIKHPPKSWYDRQKNTAYKYLGWSSSKKLVLKPVNSTGHSDAGGNWTPGPFDNNNAMQMQSLIDAGRAAKEKERTGKRAGWGKRMETLDRRVDKVIDAQRRHQKRSLENERNDKSIGESSWQVGRAIVPIVVGGYAGYKFAGSIKPMQEASVAARSRRIAEAAKEAKKTVKEVRSGKTTAGIAQTRLKGLGNTALKRRLWRPGGMSGSGGAVGVGGLVGAYFLEAGLLRAGASVETAQRSKEVMQSASTLFVGFGAGSYGKQSIANHTLLAGVAHKDVGDLSAARKYTRSDLQALADQGKDSRQPKLKNEKKGKNKGRLSDVSKHAKPNQPKNPKRKSLAELRKTPGTNEYMKEKLTKARIAVDSHSINGKAGSGRNGRVRKVDVAKAYKKAGLSIEPTSKPRRGRPIGSTSKVNVQSKAKVTGQLSAKQVREAMKKPARKSASSLIKSVGGKRASGILLLGALALTALGFSDKSASAKTKRKPIVSKSRFKRRYPLKSGKGLSKPMTPAQRKADLKSRKRK